MPRNAIIQHVLLQAYKEKQEYFRQYGAYISLLRSEGIRHCTESLRGCLNVHRLADPNVTFNVMYSVKQNSSKYQVSK